VRERIADLRRLTDLPLGVGFGIRSAEDAARIAEFADAAVVGSALVRRIEENLGHREATFAAVEDLLRAMRHAMDARTQESGP